MFWVISVYFNIRNTLPKSGTFLLEHPVYIYIYVCVCMCMYTYIYRERERERETIKFWSSCVVVTVRTVILNWFCVLFLARHSANSHHNGRATNGDKSLYMYTYIHAYIRKYVHIYTHTHIYMYTYTHTCIYTYIHTHILKIICVL